MSQEKGSEMFPSGTERKQAAKTHQPERGTFSKHTMKPLQQVERDSGSSGSPSQQVERDSWPQTKPRPFEPSKHQLGLPSVYQRMDSGVSDSLSPGPSPSASFISSSSRASIDSAIGTSLGSSFKFPSLPDNPVTPESEFISFSISSNVSDQSDYSSLQPSKLPTDSLSSALDTPQPSYIGEKPSLTESTDEVDGCESHDPNDTITEDRDRSNTLVNLKEHDTEDLARDEFVETTPANSPSTTREISVTTEEVPFFADLSLSYDYQKYLESFFQFFVTGLCLREDTAYAVFNSEKVDALGFGVKKDRVVPCLRVCTHSPSSEWPALREEVGSHLMTAIEKAGLADKALSLPDVMNYTEMDSTENSIFRPEELMSGVSPGEQFKVKEEFSCGTIGYYIKAKLKVWSSEKCEDLERHFGITCAHCAVPTSFMWSIIDDADENEIIKKDYDSYRLRELFDHMWEDSEHQPQVSKLKRLLRSKSDSTGPAVYNELKTKQELCFLKASICPLGMRDILKRKNIHYINNQTPSSPNESDYEYILSKFGMIPRQVNIPLPTYVFHSKCRECPSQGSCKCDGLDHYPFNVDVGVLEVKEPFGSHSSHSLSSAIREKSNIVHVSSFDKDDPAVVVKRKEGFEFKACNTSQHITSPTSGFVQPRPREEESTSDDQGSMSHDQGSMSSDQGSMSRDQGSRSHDFFDQESISCNNVSPRCEAHCVVNQFPLLYERQKTSETAIPPQESSPPPKNKNKSINKKIRQVASTVVATGINMFSKTEQKHLQLQVLSSNGSNRSQRRTIRVNNNQFCLEFVHRNPNNRSQLRSFPTIKWKPDSEQKDFIIRGDSGSSLFLVNNDSSVDDGDRLVLLGIVGSASTGTRVDFIKEVIAPDLCQYMTSELLKDESIDSFLRNACETLQSRLSLSKQLKTLSKEPESFQRLCNDLQTRGYSSWGNKVTFEITECIDGCV